MAYDIIGYDYEGNPIEMRRNGGAVGYRDIIGDDDDDDEVSGPRRKKRKASQAAEIAAMAAQMVAAQNRQVLGSGGSPRLAPEDRSILRTLTFGFTASPAGAIAPGGTVELFGTADSETLRVERCFLDSLQLSGWTVLDLKVGRTSQLTSRGTLPASMFGPTAVGSALRGNTVQIGGSITWLLRNDNAVPSVITAAIIGSSLGS